MVAVRCITLCLPLVLLQTVSAYTLVDAVDAVRVYAPELAAAAERLASDEQRIQGQAQLLPRVSLDTRYASGPRRSTMQFGSDGRVAELNGALSLRQPVFDVPRYARYERGIAIAEEGAAAFSLSRQKIVLETANAYLDVLGARQNLKTTETSLAALDWQLAKVRDEAALGLSDSIDAREAGAAYDAAAAEHLGVLHTLRNSERTFERLTGLDATQVTGAFLSLPPDHDRLLKELTAQGVHPKNNAALRHGLTKIEVAQAEYRERKGLRLPTVELYAQQHYRDESKGTFDYSARRHSSSFGVALNWDIYLGGATQSQVREAEHNLISLKKKAQALRLSADSAIRRQILAVELGGEQIRATRRQVRSAESKLAATRDGKELGVRSNLDILKAEDSFSDAKRQLANAYHAYFEARLQLAFEQGRLEDGTLKTISDALSPAGTETVDGMQYENG